MNTKEYSMDWGGKPLTIRVGKLARQAGGSCTVQYGDTVVLCTATMGELREDLNFFPLHVDFEERMYAAGKIKGSRFMKREGRPTDEAVLTGRLIDRAIRPMFPDGVKREVAVIVTALSHDFENDGDMPGFIGASCALAISDIPWNGPIAAVRVGKKDGQWIANPTYKEIEEGGVDIVVAGRNNKTVMLEAGVNIMKDEDVADAIIWSHEHITPIVELIKKIQSECGKEKISVEPRTDEERKAWDEHVMLKKIVEDFVQERASTTLFAEPLISKHDRKDRVNLLKDALHAHLETTGVDTELHKRALGMVDEAVDGAVTRLILDEKRRADGRALDEIRPLVNEVGILPRTHGSGLFERGATQVLSTVTLGSPGMEQTLDTMEFETKKNYFHHYNFPSFSVGETRPNRGPGRREIGHGALAERALIPVLPKRESFPYTIRVVSEVFGSNGSSSMGATCGSTLALLDAGVPITAPVAGIAIGVASIEEEGRFQIITDLQDLEDGKGGMDFKVTGTRDGLTAIQMDTKTQGIPFETVREAVSAGRSAINRILDSIQSAIAEPRSDLSKWAPRIESLRIKPDRIRDVIGSGGKIINEIIDTCNVQIDIEDDGLVMVTSTDAEGMKRAMDWIKKLTEEVEVGKIYDGKVTRLMDFGAFVEILPKQEGLVHVSEMAPYRVENVSDIVKLGDTVRVKVYELDNMGRINLSMKRTLSDEEAEKVRKDYTEKHPGGSDHGSRPDSRQDRRSQGGRPKRPHSR
ncbi:MAG: polyribonucleotide nucleotidyltransferase [bacterium]|nr:polyribonucleotide nucleotidyltransferase [bacterium]